MSEIPEISGISVDQLPASMSHATALAKLPDPKQRAQVWGNVLASASGRGITAKDVEAAVAQYQASLAKNWITLEEWNAGDRWHGGPSDKTMNAQDDKNIEWAAWSWNPVTGCLHGCDYCYARDIANRFYPYGFQPAFLPERLEAPANTKSIKPRWDGDIGYRNVFTCSMADLFGKWVPQEWIDAVIQTATDNPQWTFLFLSKFPQRMAEFTYPANVWLGTTVDRQWAVERAEKAFRKIKASGFDGVCWLSCEPMLERLTFGSLEMFDWVVMGGSSRSTQTPEYRPPFDDIVHLYDQARAAGCQVYQKTNLIPGMSDEQRIREYPLTADAFSATLESDRCSG
jgi:protein gp37